MKNYSTFRKLSKHILQWWQITKKQYIMLFHSLQLTLSLGCLKWKLTRQSTSDFRFGHSNRMDFWCIMQVNFVFSRSNFQPDKINDKISWRDNIVFQLHLQGRRVISLQSNWSEERYITFSTWDMVRSTFEILLLWTYLIINGTKFR